MKDPLWQGVYTALLPLLDDTDIVMAPRGDWPAFPCAAILYDDLIDLKNCTILVLHKGQLTSLPKAELQHVAKEWQWIFANEVFVVLSRSRKIKEDVRRSTDFIHWKPLTRFLSSALLRKRRSRIVYVHVPKTGGTSMWASLTRAFPSHVYYPSPRAYLSNPPAQNDYDLIGLHFSPSVLLPSLREDDWVIGMVRDPTQRLLSAVRHSRRETEDTETFTASAKAMREMDLAQYIATDLGRLEARLQLITFGTDYRRPAYTLSDYEMLCSARALAQQGNVVLAPSERSSAFMELVAKRLAFRPGPLRRLNANEPSVLAANLTEFNNAIGLIDSINAHEREFYDFVCRSFDRLRATGRQWRGRQNRRSPVLNAAPAMDGNRGSSGARGPHGLVIAERN
jgi:Sulfotransferase family